MIPNQNDKIIKELLHNITNYDNSKIFKSKINGAIPIGCNFIVFSDETNTRRSTNYNSYKYLSNSKIIRKGVKQNYKIDVYGNDAWKIASKIETCLHDLDFLKNINNKYNISINNISNILETSYVDESNEYNERFTFNFDVDYNEEFTFDQQFFDSYIIKLKPLI